MKKVLLFILLVPFAVQAQYWQQRVNTSISVRLNDSLHFLDGEIAMDYHNHSPDTLTFIYFHLYPNAYLDDRTAYAMQAVENGQTDFYFAAPDDRGYMDSLSFKVDNKKAGLMPTTNADVVKLILPDLLLPGGVVKIETPFCVKIPEVFSRLGHDGQSYQISQWFPKPAVYDKNGWHPMPYLDQGEFYSEFGTYDVAITLPADYIVMATGNLENEQEQEWLDSLARLPLPADSLPVAAAKPASVMKTLHFHEENIHDFAWFADKRWIVRKETITLGSGREVEAYSCFLPAHQEGWKNSLGDIRTAVMGYSEQVGEYPFKTVKAVEGALSAGGGMEYPTVTVIAATNDRKLVNTVIIHEVGHNWFYGILGSNERDFPWLDEGINSFYENKFTTTDEGQRRLFTEKGLNYLVYAMLSASRNLMPADKHASYYTKMNYGADIYIKVPYLLSWLEDYMGADTFRTAMQDYFETWKFKHPRPEDFEAILKKHSAKDINWFFECLNDSRPVDFAVKHLNRKGGQTSVKLINKSGLEGPVKLRLSGIDSRNNRVNLLTWSEPFNDATTVAIKGTSGITWEKVEIDPVIPDYRPANNSSSRSFGLGFLAGTNLQAKEKIWLTPSMGYNFYDGFMAGVLMHNLTIPENKFQFAITPMYGFKSRKITGTGMISRTFYFDKGPLHNFRLDLEGKSFDFWQSGLNMDLPVSARFVKLAPQIIFNFRKPFPRSSLERSLGLKAYWIREDRPTFKQDQADSLYRPIIDGYHDYYYGRVWYKYKKATTFNPYSYMLEGQIGAYFAKLSVEANFKVDYNVKNKALYARMFAGKFFSFENSINTYRYQLSTTFTGQNDYLYDETYISRNEQGGNGWQNQISMREGGFKVNTLKYAQPLGRSDNWLFALNVKTDIPYQPLPLRLFTDVAAYTGAKETNPSGSAILYEAGVELFIGPYFSIYFPLICSEDLSQYSKTVLGKARFGKAIAFSLNIGDVNWPGLSRKALEM